MADLETWSTEMSNCIRLYCQMGMKSSSDPAERADLKAWRDQIQVCIDRYNSVREEVIRRNGASSVRCGPFIREGVPRF